MFDDRNITYVTEHNLTYVTQEGKDGDENLGYVANINNGVTIGYKYFDFKGVTGIELTSRGYGSGVFEIRTEIDGEILATVPLLQIVAQLPEEFFYMCHRSYIVNLVNIRSVSTTVDKITLVDGTVLPISRRRKANFMGAREKFMQNHTYTIIS